MHMLSIQSADQYDERKYGKEDEVLGAGFTQGDIITYDEPMVFQPDSCLSVLCKLYVA